MALPTIYGPYVPSDIIKKYIVMWMACNPERNFQHVAWVTGLPQRTIYRVIYGGGSIRFNTADQILIRLGYYDAWATDEELTEYYDAA